jgi:PAS domain S-box-containing protein
MKTVDNLKEFIKRKYQSAHRLPAPWSYIFALIVVLIAALLRIWLHTGLTRTPFLAFYPALVIAAAIGGFWPGLLAVMASWLCVTLFFDESPGYIGLSNPAELERLLAFLSGGLGVSLVSEAQLRGRERTLKQAQELEAFRQLTDSGPFMIRDDADRIIHWSEGCASLYGFSADQALGHFSHELLKTQFSEPLEKISATLQETGRWQGELVQIRADETAISIASLWILRRSSPAPVILEISSDITRLKQAEEALRRSEEQLRVATLAAEIGVWSWRAGMEFATVSANWKLLFGMALDAEVKFQTWHDAIHPEDRDPAMREFTSINQVHPEFSMEYRVILPDGSMRWVADRGRAIYDAGGHATEIAGITIDITKRKSAEEDLLRTSRELERSNKDLESFAYIASHDLQEPLRTITGFLQLLEHRIGNQLDEKTKQYIQYAVDGSKRMHQMITDLLSYSRVNMQALSPKTLNLRDALEHALSSTRKSIEDSGASIVIEDLPSVRADASQMLQVFQNLLGNAIKFRSERPLKIQIGARKEQQSWVLWVKDNGIGLDPKQSDRIFQVFQRLHSRQKYAGSGIGLSICKKIIERHGGSIWVESTPNVGSTFFFTLPSN